LPARREARDTADSSAAFALGELASGAYQWWRRHDEYDVSAEEEAEISSAMAEQIERSGQGSTGSSS
jgi:hypothetical protein